MNNMNNIGACMLLKLKPDWVGGIQDAESCQSANERSKDISRTCSTIVLRGAGKPRPLLLLLLRRCLGWLPAAQECAFRQTELEDSRDEPVGTTTNAKHDSGRNAHVASAATNLIIGGSMSGEKNNKNKSINIKSRLRGANII